MFCLRACSASSGMHKDGARNDRQRHLLQAKIQGELQRLDGVVSLLQTTGGRLSDSIAAASTVGQRQVVRLLSPTPHPSATSAASPNPPRHLLASVADMTLRQMVADKVDPLALIRPSPPCSPTSTPGSTSFRGGPSAHAAPPAAAGGGGGLKVGDGGMGGESALREALSRSQAEKLRLAAELALIRAGRASSTTGGSGGSGASLDGCPPLPRPPRRCRGIGGLMMLGAGSFETELSALR